MTRNAVVLWALVILVFGSGCQFRPSPEDQAKIDALQLELKAVNADIAEAERKNAEYTGGLVKALVEVRLESLKTTETLIQQRIHALESGAHISTTVPGSQVDQKLAESLEADIKKQEDELKAANDDAARYSGGLVGAMKQATVATQEQSLAMLKGRYLAAKYGLPTAGPATARDATASTAGVKPGEVPISKDPAKEIVTVRLLRKKYAEQDYQDYIWFDIEFTAAMLDKPSRAIKGVLHLQDLFGESKMNVNWSIDQPLEPGAQAIEKGTGFEFNKFTSEHKWVRATDLNNMTASFSVHSILYADGTRKDLE